MATYDFKDDDQPEPKLFNADSGAFEKSDSAPEIQHGIPVDMIQELRNYSRTIDK